MSESTRQFLQYLDERVRHQRREKQLWYWTFQTWRMLRGYV